MRRCGYSEAELNDMSEDEFCFWRDQNHEYDELVKEAAEEQARQARKNRDKP